MCPCHKWSRQGSPLDETYCSYPFRFPAFWRKKRAENLARFFLGIRKVSLKLYRSSVRVALRCVPVPVEACLKADSVTHHAWKFAHGPQQNFHYHPCSVVVSTMQLAHSATLPNFHPHHSFQYYSCSLVFSSWPTSLHCHVCTRSIISFILQELRRSLAGL